MFKFRQGYVTGRVTSAPVALDSNSRNHLGKPQKESYFLSGRATKRGRGLNGCATKEKRTFFVMQGKKFIWPLSRGGGALVAGKELFFAASLTECLKQKF